MIVGTAGHIDHGKTSLVYALTGVDTDRLKEEKERGISIELGYAYTPLADGRVLGYIDVPGHERLVHTMVAGAAGIDFALLVVAADDGVMPQTREHLSILGLFGVTRGAVALTKVDRVDEARVREASAEVTALIERTTLRDVPIFPLNATAPDHPGIAALRAYLHTIAMAWPGRAANGLFRLAVDRVFTLPGRGTVATGTVHAGQVRVGDTLAAMPGGVSVRVRSIHAQNRDAEIGRAGQRCALNLPGIEKTALKRGDWLADSRALTPTMRIDVNLRRLDDDGRPLADGTLLHIHLGTAHRVARAILLEGNQLSGGAGARAQLVFDAPICASTGDRFIARDARAMHTIGGGVVIDASAPARRRRSSERLAYLDAIQSLLEGEGVGPLLRNAPQGVSMQELVRLCGCAQDQIAMPPQTRIVKTGGESFVFLETAWRDLCGRALEALRAFHSQSPDEPGLDGGRWRRMTMPTLADSVWRAVIDDLLLQGAVQRRGHWLHSPEHRIALGGAELALLEKLQSAILAGRFDPPWVRELCHVVQAPEDEVRLVLRKCAAQGGVYQIVRDLFYHRECVRELSLLLKEIEHAHGVIEPAQFRDALKVGRKRAIQILEFFDRVGYTRRTSVGRKLRADGNWHDVR